MPVEGQALPTPSHALGLLPLGHGLAPGSRAPDAELRDLDGRRVRLSDAIKWGPVLLVFFRGTWCPYCRTALEALAAAAPGFGRRGVSPIGISAEPRSAAAKLLASSPFPVLEDEELEAHDAYAVRAGAEPYALPAFFLVDARGTVRWSHVCEDFRVRPSVGQVLGCVDEVLRARSSNDNVISRRRGEA